MSAKVLRKCSAFSLILLWQNSKMAAMLGETNFFSKIGMATLHRYPVGQKFRRNRSIYHGFRDISIFVFCNFCEKNSKNSKWPPFWARQNFFENWDGHSAEIPCGSKISSKSLYLARFSRYKHFCVFLIWKICND